MRDGDPETHTLGSLYFLTLNIIEMKKQMFLLVLMTSISIVSR